MKNTKFYVCSTLIAATLSLAPLVQGESETNAAKMDSKMEEMMKKAEEMGKPGEGHQVLEPLIGDWEVEAKCWMNPGEAPQISKGSAKAMWIMGGRFVQEDFDGEMMGKPFHGMSLAGYDNMNQKYQSVWIDDMSTAIFTSEGTAGEEGKVLTFTSTMDCPMTGEKDLPVKQVIRIISNDKHTFEMYDLRKTDNNKTMELTYTRKQ
ncbi:MAG: DUF1579 domain-containing protein [Verrucomicrobiae bacterium]|nr:DUF1579 domain-containing protein [Verrucomicrobiae bacterium]